MEKIFIILFALIFQGWIRISENTNVDPPLTQVTFDNVKLEDNFWKPRLDIQAKILVPYAMDKTVTVLENLKKTANFLKGDTTDLPFPHRYISSDLYKVMEGASYILMNNPNPELEKKMDDIIEIISQAQKKDGYLYVAHTTGVSQKHDHWGGGGMGDKPYSFVLHSHELYNMGHMYEAAAAYYLATGKDKWLKVAEKNAQHLNKVFFEGDPRYNNGNPVNQAPGHQEIELALVKLYNVTENRLYLEMAYKFLDIRGKTFVPEGKGVMSPTYAQQHKPVSLQREAVGHAVRAMYQYSAMADVSSHFNITKYKLALDSIWHNLVDAKMHITGGLGAMHGIEGFGPDYKLPNKEAYNETCAAVGNVLFNYRMFLLSKNAKYMDVAEIALFNNALAGINLEGNKFFYVNPLEYDGKTSFNHGNDGRAPWFGTACCPTNLARLIPQVPGMMYSYNNEDIYVTFYASNSTSIKMPKGNVKIQQISNYPLDGLVKLKIDPENTQKFNLKLRIPTWAQNEKFVPGELYKYINNTSQNEWSIKVNGKEENYTLNNGFVVISRKWEKGDKVVLNLKMNVKYNKSHELIKNNKGRLAVTRGPLLYCVEGNNSNESVENLNLKINPKLSQINVKSFSSSVLKNVLVINLPFEEKTKEQTLKRDVDLIPYYAWNNRGNNPMSVWIKYRKEQH
ncbi:MAG: glycoside hydrolase family 127 protein [bacterium]